MSISFAKINTKSAYEALTPVQDRLYFIEETGEQFLNGKPYNGDDGSRDWLCFTNTYEGTNTVKIVLVDNPTPASLEFSKDGENWTQVIWSNGESQTVTLANGEKVYFRGDNPNFSYGQWNSSLGIDIYHKFVLGQPSACSGSILSLFSKDCKYEGAIRVNRLFQECLITTPPKLSANVQSYGYKQLFWNCTSLEYAPELPAVNLGAGCYDSMFDGCTSLHVAPELPATIMQNNCYKSMFKGCTALWQCPELPSVNLAISCYESMFEGCTDLGAAMAVLPAPNARNNCYKYMFKGTKIRTTPEIKITYSSQGCMYGMFQNCNLLYWACDLLLINAVDSCCRDMFYSCTNLVRPPSELKPSYVNSNAYIDMFNSCNNLRYAPVIQATSYANNALDGMFANCNQLRWIRVEFTSWNTNTYSWVWSVYGHGVFECPNQLPAEYGVNRIPSNWTKTSTRSAYKTVLNTVMPSTYYDDPSSVTLTPTGETYYCIDVKTHNLTLSAVTSDDWYMAEALVQLRIYNGYKVNAGTNMTIVGNLGDGNHWCTCRWYETHAVLYSDETVQSDWDESDSSSPAYIQNKPEFSSVPDDTPYLCFTSTVANSTVRLDKVGTDSYIPTISLEYSTDKATWTEYTWSGMTGATITLASIGNKVWFRGDNAKINQGTLGYHQFVMTGGVEATGNIMSLFSKDCSKTDIVGQFTGLFRDCTALVKADVFPSSMGKITGLEMTFMGCTGLTSVELPDCTLSGNYVMTNTFNGCTNLARVKVGFHEWSSSGMNNWLGNVAVNGVFICPSDLPIVRGTNRIPTGWKVEFESAPQADWDESDNTKASYVQNRGISTETAVSDSTYTVNAGVATTPIITVASALTLNAGTVASGKIAYAEVVLDVATNATVTAGSNITFVDTLTAEKRNVCVARWQDGACKLYVVITEDLPVDESSSN